MNVYKIAAVVATAALLSAGTSGAAFAASSMTNIFMTNLVPNVDFLDRSSRFALTNSKDARIRDFAYSQAREQTLAANDLDDWIAADKNLGAVPGPATVASTPNADGVTTGRSVAIEGQVDRSTPQAIPTADHRLALGQEDLDSIEGLEGSEFDKAYKTKQLDALTQIETDYQDYITKGDDPTLRAMAVRELPSVKRRLAALSKL